MNILSLFDGISCARLSLDRANIQVSKYYASEIDKYAIYIAKKNYADTVHVGSVVGYSHDGFIDLLIGGSPCQDLSIAKRDRKGLYGDRSSLFWEYVRILKESKPKYFVLENVASMSRESKEIITNSLLEVYSDTVCHLINATLVSAQNRKRLFRTNIQGIEQPQDRGIFLKDILEDEVDKKYYVNNADIQSITENKSNSGLRFVGGIRNKDRAKDGKSYSRNFGQGDRIYSIEGKSTTLSAHGGGRGAKTGLYLEANAVRKLTPKECERLQGVPDGYTEGVSNSQRYKMLGNAFNVDVVSHILSYIKNI